MMTKTIILDYLTVLKPDLVIFKIGKFTALYETVFHASISSVKDFLANIMWAFCT